MIFSLLKFLLSTIFPESLAFQRGSDCCDEVQTAVTLIIYCTAALTSLSDNVSYMIVLFSEWRIRAEITVEILNLVSLSLASLCLKKAKVFEYRASVLVKANIKSSSKF